MTAARAGLLVLAVVGCTGADRVTAETDCELFSLPHGELRAAMSAHRKLGEALLWAFGRALSRRLRDAQERALARPTRLA